MLNSVCIGDELTVIINCFSLSLYFRNLGMKQKYVSDPFVRIRLRPKQEGPYHTRRKSEDTCSKEQKRTSVRNISLNSMTLSHL